MQDVIKNPWLLFLGIVLGPFMMGIDFLAIGVAVEPMAKELSIDMSTLQWFLTAFAIGNASFLVTSGRLADIYGRKTVYISGLLVFIFSSMTIALAHSALLIIIARAVQGASAGVMSTTAIAILTHLYNAEERAKWFVLLIGLTGVGMVLGPAVGGYLTHYFTWRMVFIINAPIGLFGLLLTVFYVPKLKVHGAGQRLDIMGVLLLAMILGLFTIAVSQGQSWGWSSLQTIGSFIGTFLLLMIFLYVEAKHPNPLFEFSLFKIQNFFAANVSGFIAYFLLTAWILLFGIYLQRVMGMTPLGAGFSLLPFGIVVAVTSGFVVKITEWFGLRRLIVIGFFFGLLAFSGLATIPVYPSIAILILWFGLYGGCFVLVNSCSVSAALQFIPVEKAGIASGKSLMIRWLGGAIGAAVMSTIFTVVKAKQMERSGMSIVQSYHHALIICMVTMASLSFLALLISQFGIKQKTV